MPPVPPQQTPMFVLLLIHLALGVGLLLTGDRLGRHAFTVAALAPALTVGWMLSQVGTVVGVEGEPREESVVWVEGLNITDRKSVV